MKVHTSTLWNQPRIMGAIIRNGFVLDPTVFFGNPRVYYLKRKGALCSFVAIKRHGSAYELKSVYTSPDYRTKGYMHLLIKHVLKRYPSSYLICKPRLVPFYTTFEFTKTNHASLFLRFEKRFANFFISQRKNRLVLMKRVTPLR